ncbi:MAG: glycoside hydrolase family 1 protein [Candidatus Sericytochromatia bacterium]|nr:glycoside hydrolase family 1 protein [Candidatus Tanganyikabacteria bacterium]
MRADRPRIRFPTGFLWGAATAAHQVEGGLDNDWARFEAQPGRIRHGHTSAAGVDHFHRYAEDFALAAGMGHNAHRLSIEWSRIEPRRGHWDAGAVAHYRDVLSALRRLGMEPVVTLHHFTNPRWVADQGGWESPRTAADFARFAAFAGACLGDLVRLWCSVNEANGLMYMAYLNEAWPPAKRDPAAAWRVHRNMLAGHLRAYHALHEAYRAHGRGVQVGVAHHFMIFDAARRWHPVDQASARAADWVCNRAFLHSAWRRSALDFIGVNYYQRGLCRGFAKPHAAPGAPTSDLGWEIRPEGLYRSLRIAARYSRLPDGRRIPLYITENGLDDRGRGEERARFIVRHLQHAGRALADGLDVRGYLHWTLMDNFEWAEGYEPRFGLFRVDRAHGLARVPTLAVEVYREIARHNGLTANLLAAYGELRA